MIPYEEQAETILKTFDFENASKTIIALKKSNVKIPTMRNADDFTVEGLKEAARISLNYIIRSANHSREIDRDKPSKQCSSGCMYAFIRGDIVNLMLVLDNKLGVSYYEYV